MERGGACLKPPGWLGRGPPSSRERPIHRLTPGQGSAPEGSLEASRAWARRFVGELAWCSPFPPTAEGQGSEDKPLEG